MFIEIPGIISCKDIIFVCNFYIMEYGCRRWLVRCKKWLYLGSNNLSVAVWAHLRPIKLDLPYSDLQNGIWHMCAQTAELFLCCKMSCFLRNLKLAIGPIKGYTSLNWFIPRLVYVYFSISSTFYLYYTPKNLLQNVPNWIFLFCWFFRDFS